MFDSTYSKKDLVIDILLSLVATAIMGLAYAVFTIPNDIAPGGVSGLATALADIIPLSVGVLSLLFNIPLLILCWKSMGIRNLVFTLMCTAFLSFFIDFFDTVIPGYTNNVMLASLYGGVISGFGIGLLFLRGLSTGGTDLFALLIKKVFPNTPSGTLLLMTNAAVVVVAMLIFQNLEVGLYSVITIFVSSKVIDAITTGVDYAKVIYVITSKGEYLASQLMEVASRGTTLLPAVGGYTKEEKQMVMIVTRRSTVSTCLRTIRKADPSAFAFVVDSNEVHGEGFKID